MNNDQEAPANVLSHLFPRDAHHVESRAEANAASRVGAGIHIGGAADAGLQFGREAGDAMIAWAESHGAK